LEPISEVALTNHQPVYIDLEVGTSICPIEINR
jgi:hypothetical protein